MDVKSKIYFKQERVTGKATQMLPLKDSRWLETKRPQFTFAGMHLSDFDSTYHIGQNFYMNNIE